MAEFSQAVIEQLRYYVYFLQDPGNGEVFYVGKGMGNRVFQHVAGAMETDAESEKLDRIREIVDSGQSVGIRILRHGLEEATAFEIEAAMIDFIGRNNLTNVVGGRFSNFFGLRTPEELSDMYDAEELATSEPILLININRKYRRNMTENELYEATRNAWRLGWRRNKVRYAVATYNGLTREAYSIEEWYQPPDEYGRWAFVGARVEDERVRGELVQKSIKSYQKPGQANPIKYLNC